MSFVGGDKKNSFGDLFRAAQAFERNAGSEVGLLLVRPREAGEHFRFDRARSDDTYSTVYPPVGILSLRLSNGRTSKASQSDAGLSREFETPP